MSDCAPSSWRWQHHAELASTQSHAIEAALAGQPGRLAVLADVQTNGRGSRGRSWIAPDGNLNLSLLLRPERASPDPGRWAMLAGVALHAALHPYATGLVLKWPNDLLCQGGKLGGILIDSALDAEGRLDWVVIGIGVNLLRSPELDGRPTAHLGSAAPAARVLAGNIVAAWEEYADCNVRDAWLARAHPPGTLLTVDIEGRRLTAPFAGLTTRGELLLDGHPSPIGSADVFVGRPAAFAGVADGPFAADRREAPCC